MYMYSDQSLSTAIYRWVQVQFNNTLHQIQDQPHTTVGTLECEYTAKINTIKVWNV